jgi:uncharacterized membrane protein (UPF0127 family)
MVRSASTVRTSTLRRILTLHLAAAALATQAVAAPPVIPLTLPSGRRLAAEVMTTDEERGLGLMFREGLAQDRALLFVFEESAFHSVWMKNCRFAIDMVWLDDERRVVHLAEDVPPCRRDPCPTYRPLRRARYVLELNAGQARREGLLTGAVAAFTWPLP